MFHDILKCLRMEKNMSQQELADIVGKTQQAVYLWEKGENEPGIESLNILADYFGVTIDYLTGRKTQEVVYERLTKGLDQEDIMILESQADYLRYRKKLPDDRRDGLSGLTDTDKEGKKPRFKKAK